MRVGDRDREVVVDGLRTAYEEGRLDLAEFDDRLSRAGAAGTFGELNELVADLPATPAAPPRPRPARRPAPSGMRSADVLRAGSFVVLVNLGYWLVLATDQGFDQVHPWWVWVVALWGLGLLGTELYTKRCEDRQGIDGASPRALDDGQPST
ncbi:hypothetical protein GCM10022224_052610 [Nonomuraea antimicrobica]|uniref:DUF1707 domain-containing protein n=1 Tax=Nonomuraea antimicrobica TaxID=561173 RepID=A0ABP7C9E9_9ACTN